VRRSFAEVVVILGSPLGLAGAAYRADVAEVG
jgi:hypothetical protein